MMINPPNNGEKYEDEWSNTVPEEESLMPKPSGELTNPFNEETILDGREGREVKEKEESTKMYTRRLTDIAIELQASPGETSCGIGCIKGSLLQTFANKKAFVSLYGILGSVTGSTNAYFNGTITTLEKRFKIPSTNTGIILVGGDVSQLFLGLLLNYYGGRGHRPRWIAFGVLTTIVYCLMNALCHFLYGPGEDALYLTEEFGGHHDNNTTARLIDAQNRRSLCQREGVSVEDCTNPTEIGNLAPQIILFLAQFMSGIGGSLYYTLGVSYMDDNIQKSKSPALVGLSFFMRMLGPAFGYTLASVCLSMFISPSLTPTITKRDPRWLGAWWIGWLLIGFLQVIFGAVIGMFPKTLPRAAARRILASERQKAAGVKDTGEDAKNEAPPSLKDMVATFKRLMSNKILMCNNFASVFYLTGFMPFWTFMPKYIETIYRQSASFASFITGTVGLIFSGIGILGSSLLISKVKPKARTLAFWNVAVGIFGTMGFISYTFLGCPHNERQSALLASGLTETTACNQDCQCHFVKYSPVCSPDGRTFTSPCHAGCNDYRTLANGSKVYTDCSCAPRPTLPTTNLSLETVSYDDSETSWFLTEGACRVDCGSKFYIYLAIVCFVKFIGASGRTSNFLVSLRCVDEKDKTVSMAVALLLMTVFAFIPAPILFGYFIDSTCLIWGKTCTKRGNCWLYNADKLKYLTNFTSAAFIALGTVCDVGVWYYVKELKVFDEEVEEDSQKAKQQRT